MTSGGGLPYRYRKPYMASEYAPGNF